MLDQKKYGSVHQVTVSYKLGCPSLGNGEHNWLSPLLVLVQIQKKSSLQKGSFTLCTQNK